MDKQGFDDGSDYAFSDFLSRPPERTPRNVGVMHYTDDI